MERHNFTKLIIFVINLYLITLGLGWIFLHFYLRLFIKRNSITSDELNLLLHISIGLFIYILPYYIYLY